MRASRMRQNSRMATVDLRDLPLPKRYAAILGPHRFG